MTTVPNDVEDLVLELDLEELCGAQPQNASSPGEPGRADVAAESPFAVPPAVRQGWSRAAILLGTLGIGAVLAVALQSIDGDRSELQDPLAGATVAELLTGLDSDSTRDLALAHLARRDADAAVELLRRIELRAGADWLPTAYDAVARMPSSKRTRELLMRQMVKMLNAVPGGHRATSAIEAVHLHHLTTGAPGPDWPGILRSAHYTNSDALQAGNAFGSLAFENAVVPLLSFAPPPSAKIAARPETCWDWAESAPNSHRRVARMLQILRLPSLGDDPSLLVAHLTSMVAVGSYAPGEIEETAYRRLIAPRIARLLLAGSPDESQRRAAHDVLLRVGDVIERRDAVRELRSLGALDKTHRDALVAMSQHAWHGLAREAIVALPDACARNDGEVLELLDRLARHSSAEIARIAASARRSLAREIR